MIWGSMQVLVLFFKISSLVLSVFFLSGCQLGYLLKTADGQYRMMDKKVTFEKVLADPSVNDETKNKIKLVQDTKAFTESHLGLIHSKNYESFVKLEDRYVTYVVTASPQDKIEA